MSMLSAGLKAAPRRPLTVGQLGLCSTVPIMRTIKQPNSRNSFVLALLLTASLAATFSVTAVTLPPGGLAAAPSGNDLVLSFQTASPQLYTVQTSPDLVQPWSAFQGGIQGDGTVKTVTVSNALSGNSGFYRLLVENPVQLVLPQSMAFAILGHSCGGIKEQTYLTGFDPVSGYPMGDVYLSTTCSTGGRGSPPATFTAWAAVTWDFSGNAISSGTLSNSAAANPSFMASDAYGDTIYNIGTIAHLTVPTPSTPTGVNAVQSGDQFQVSWTPNGINPLAVTSSTVTATPLNSTAPVLTASVTGPGTTAVIPTLQPQTTYEITVVNASIGGASHTSTPVEVTTAAASIAPSAPGGLTASWSNLNPTGTTDTLVASWQAADPGNAPVDDYQVTITGSDGGGTFSQTVSGTTLTTYFNVDYIPNWTVSVQAHNVVGWGPASKVTLGGL